MSPPPDIEWITPFLAKLRCPCTHEALHVASEDEMRLHGLGTGALALINDRRTHLYPVVEGIPHLLPTSAILVQDNAREG